MIKAAIPAIIVLALLMVSCGGDSTTTGPTPTPPSTTTTIPAVPELISSEVQINRSTRDYHYIGWKFAIKSPKPYSYAYVEIR